MSGSKEEPQPEPVTEEEKQRFIAELTERHGRGQHMKVGNFQLSGGLYIGA